MDLQPITDNGRVVAAVRTYEGLLTVRSDAEGCTDLVIKDKSRRRPATGKRMSLTFSSSDGLVDSGSTWCRGKANVSITTSRNGDDSGNSGGFVGIVSFRFRAQP